MTTTAIIMMIVSMVLIWGGLVLAIINLTKRSDAAAEDDTRPAGRHRRA